jgi:NAD(P)-dependent dehydrogenase (short-subunit alcohol dehydrogenase family)
MLSEKIILITGVGGGIGSVLADYFETKVKSLITASRTHREAKNGVHFPLDLSIEGNIVSLFQDVAQKYGKIDCVVNTVGGSLYSHRIEDFPTIEFDEIFNINLRNAFILTREAIKIMKKNNPQSGSIIHYVSSSAKKISNNKAPYGMAKTALARLIQYAAVETAEYNIKVNGITPTYVFTDRHEEEIKKKALKTGKTYEEILQSIVKSQVLKRGLYPADLIPITELLIETNVITGQIYDVSMGEVLNY